MGAAVLSCSCTVSVALLLAVRGPENWSERLGTPFYGLLGLGTAIVGGSSAGRRRLIVALSLPPLVAAPLLVLAVTLAPLAD